MITSTSNIQVKELLRLQKKSREREKEGVFIVEGPRMAEEIPRERIVKLYVSESFQAKCVKEKNDRFIQEAEVMSDTVFAHVSDTKTPQGILAVVRRMEYTAEDILGETPHVLRSTMGAIFRIPFIYTDDLKGTIDELKREGITVYAAHLKGENSYDMEDYKTACAFLIGNEGNGLTEETAACADRKILIPMEGGAESLNAAVASAVLMFEAGRQRRNKRK